MEIYIHCREASIIYNLELSTVAFSNPRNFKMYLAMLVNIFIFVVFLSIVHQAQCVARTECIRSGNFKKTRTDHALNNHVVATKEVPSRVACVWECLADQRCVSYNFQETPVNGKHACELNDQEQSSNEADLQSRSGYSYYENVPQDGVTPACDSSLCKNGGRCMDGCSNTYKCKCPSWRNGHYCEGWTDTAHNYTLSYTTKSISTFASTSSGLATTAAAFTACSWLKITSTAGGMQLFSYQNSENKQEMALTITSYVGKTRLVLNGKESFMYSAPLRDGKWHHICVTWENANGDWHFYVDGLRRGSDSALAVDQTIKEGGNFVIGQYLKSYGGSFDSGKSFQGEISQLNVWGSVLNETTILSMVHNRSVLFGNLIDWRVFQELTTGSLQVVRPAGISGNNYLVNFPAHSPDNYVQTTITDPLSDFMVGVWAKIQDSSNVALFSYTAPNSNFALHFSETSRITLVINDVESSVATERFMDDFWHHFVVAWKSSIGKIHILIDGNVRVKKSSISTGQTIEANGILTLGKYAAKTFTGSISGFNIWSPNPGLSRISAMSKGSGYESGNMLAWDSLKDSIHGNVALQPVDFVKNHYGQLADYRLKFPSQSTSNYVKFVGRPIPDLTEFSVSLWFKPSMSEGSVFGYATQSEPNTLLLYLNSYTSLSFIVYDKARTRTGLSDLSKGGWYHIAVTWKNSNGMYKLYVNGNKEKEVEIEKGKVVEGNGLLLIGQEMDSYGGGFDASQAFVGEMAHFNIWSKCFSQDVFHALKQSQGAFEGDVVSWSGFRNHIFGNVEVLTPSPCTQPSYIAQERRDEICKTKYAGSGGSPLRAMFQRLMYNKGKQWRCYRPSAWKQNHNGVYSYDTSSSEYYNEVFLFETTD